MPPIINQSSLAMNPKMSSFFFLIVLSLLLINIEASAPRRALGSASTVAQFLYPQNLVRKQYGLPPLQWSGKLSKYARWYANQRRGDCALVHSTASYGENLFWGRGKGWNIADTVATWVAEKRYYDYRKNTCVGRSDCFHFTQMVWKRTKRVGCARVTCGSGDTYIVCEYDPHGNVIGQRPY